MSQLDPVMETPTTVTLPRKRVRSLIPCGYRQEFVSGGDDEIEFSLDSGAGWGGVHITITVWKKIQDGRELLAHEVVDMRELIPSWVEAILSDGPTPKEERS